jgi:protein-L-isoaspartate(D-aspartate) O-methyltransferase
MTETRASLDSPWRQLNLWFPDWQDAEFMAAHHAAPLLADAENAGVLAGWWFVRKAECVRLRLRPSGGVDTVTPLIAQVVGALYAETTLARYAEVVYEPEVNAFGGPEAMAVAHTLFENDSRHILQYLAHTEDDDRRREIGVLLGTRLMRAAGLDFYEQGDVWAQLAAHRTPGNPSLPDTPDLVAVQMLLTSVGDAPTSPLAAAPEWPAAFEDAGRALRNVTDRGLLTRGLRAVLAHHLLFSFNRLGIPAEQQHRLAAAAQRVVFNRDITLDADNTTNPETAMPGNVAAVTTDAATADPALLRQALVAHIDKLGTFRTAQVKAAFQTVPRHLFLPDVEIEKAYAPRAALVTKRAADGTAISSASSPNIVATMLEQLQIQPGNRILEIGAATGINAALLAELTGAAGHVVTIELDQDLADGARAGLARAGYPNVEVICGDGALGHPDAAPYDRIIVTAGAWDISAPWWDQLAVGGRIVVPLRLHGSGLTRSLAFDHVEPDHMVSRSAAVCGFVPMRGAAEQAERHIRLADDVILKVDAEDMPDDAALTQALTELDQSRWTGIHVRHDEPAEHLDLWLATNAAASFGRLAVGTAARNLGVERTAVRWGGAALYDGGTVGYLTTRPHDADTDELGLALYGPDCGKLADQMSDLLARWGTERPAQPTIRAYRATTATGQEPTLLYRPDTRLTIGW